MLQIYRMILYQIYKMNQARNQNQRKKTRGRSIAGDVETRILVDILIFV